ncbi:uncharacterized protein LOC123010634 [Tribolium madens]|uniref:uncharacterized protein LOC123010634 n=1 Tax=Tribolium madens TaxID=41895 RepID=UPI001CF742D5|nr:uncharacterized protein LOC123010634 [Tribolium madens]
MDTVRDSPEQQNFLKRLVKFISYPFVAVGCKLILWLHFSELLFIRLYNIYALICQLFFFVCCALVYNESTEPEKNEEHVLIALKTLLFYSVFTYFTTKTRDIFTANRTSFFRNFNLMEGICRIVIEWAKAVIVVFCLREQGIYFKPSIPYAATTFTYYVCTEKIFTELLQKLIKHCEFEIFEDLDHLYVPLVLNVYTVTLSFTADLYLILTTDFVTFSLCCAYFTIYLRLKDSYYNFWKLLVLEKQTFNSFRDASQEDLDDYDDICAVCLNKMSKAKITPCNHFFHPYCLKECLKNSFLCPLCKVSF